jgi:hypothetical protein
LIKANACCHLVLAYESASLSFNLSYASLAPGWISLMRERTEITTASGSFINTWSYVVLLVVMLERRKQASACLNHMTGSDVQNSGSLTATAETAAGGCCCGGGRAAKAAATAALMRSFIACSNCAA